MGLTKRKKIFCDEYIATYGNATKSAIKAGYSEKTAYSAGHKLKNDPDCREYIDQKMAEVMGEKEMARLEIIQKLRFNLHYAEKTSDSNTAAKTLAELYGLIGKHVHLTGEMTNKFEIYNAMTDEELEKELEAFDEDGDEL